MRERLKRQNAKECLILLGCLVLISSSVLGQTLEEVLDRPAFSLSQCDTLANKIGSWIIEYRLNLLATHEYVPQLNITTECSGAFAVPDDPKSRFIPMISIFGTTTMRDAPKNWNEKNFFDLFDELIILTVRQETESLLFKARKMDYLKSSNPTNKNDPEVKGVKSAVDDFVKRIKVDFFDLDGGKLHNHHRYLGTEELVIESKDETSKAKKR